MLLAVIATIAGASSAFAEKWGAGIPPDQEWRCHEGSRFSQCTAKDDYETVFIAIGMNSKMETSLEKSMSVITFFPSSTW